MSQTRISTELNQIHESCSSEMSCDRRALSRRVFKFTLGNKIFSFLYEPSKETPTKASKYQIKVSRNRREIQKLLWCVLCPGPWCVNAPLKFWWVRSEHFKIPSELFVWRQRNVWNTRVFRLLVLGTFLVENRITLSRFEQLPKPENGNQRAVRLFPWRVQKDEEQRWKTSMLTAYWPGAHWDTHTRVTEEAKPQLWGETPWNTDSPGLTDAPRSQTIPASSATPIPLRLQRARRHSSSRAPLSGKRSRMAMRRGTAPRRRSCSCSLAERDGEGEHRKSISKRFHSALLYLQLS